MAKAIAQYRFNTRIEISENVDISSTMGQFMERELFLAQMDGLHHYSGEIDKPCDGANPDENTVYINLVVELDDEYIQDPKHYENLIDATILEKLEVEPPKVLDHWKCGNEQHFLIEMSKDNPKVKIDWEF